MNINRVVRNRINNALGRITKLYINRHDNKYGLNTSEKRDLKIIASVTSYPARFDTLHLCIRSILLQKKKADRIILWLDDCVNCEEMPDQLLEMQKYGLEIRFVGDNIKPHTKYFYTVQEFSNDIVITFDDDLYYSPYTISSLYKSHKKYPTCICARRVHNITYKADGNPKQYMEWEFNAVRKKEPSHNLLATGMGGVLYPPHVLPEKTFDVQSIKNECLMADDVWLKAMELLNGIKVVWTPCLIIVPPSIKENEIGLVGVNVYKNMNDEYLNYLNEKYNIYQVLRSEV